MPALAEAIIGHLTAHGPMLESAVAALACSAPNHVNAALLRLRSAGRVVQQDGVHWQMGRGAVPAQPGAVMQATDTGPIRVKETAAQEDAMAKRCSKCKQEKPPGEMRPDGKCKPCQREYMRNYFASKKADAKPPQKPHEPPKVATPKASPKVTAIVRQMKARAAAILIQPRILDLVLTDAITGSEHRIAIGLDTAKALGAQIAAL